MVEGEGKGELRLELAKTVASCPFGPRGQRRLRNLAVNPTWG